MRHGDDVHRGGPHSQEHQALQQGDPGLHGTPDVYLRVLPIDLHTGIWVVFSDASLGNDGDKSQGSFIVAFADQCLSSGGVARISIHSWKSHRLRRAVKASFGSEALAMDDSLAELEWVKALFCEVVVPGTCVCDGTRYGVDETVRRSPSSV